VLVLREPLRLIATHRSNRVAQIVRETEVLPGAGVIRGVLDNQLPQFVRALPANQIFNSSSHGISNGRKHARAEVPESPEFSGVCCFDRLADHFLQRAPTARAASFAP